MSTEPVSFLDMYSSIGVYMGITGATLVLGLTRTWTFHKVTMASSMALHKNMYNSVTRSPIKFFDTNPKGIHQCVLSPKFNVITWALIHELKYQA